MTLTPTDHQLKTALHVLRAEHPASGIAKIHAQLQAENPSWAISEKRVRKTLQAEGLTLTSAAAAPYPRSKPNAFLDPGPMTAHAVEVAVFDQCRGKGLIAARPIAEGEIVWKEDPWVVAPEWAIYDLQTRSRACQFCTSPLNESSGLVLPCPSRAADRCPARFCNRLCLSRSARVHPLLCPAQNPASIPLLAFARDTTWMALHALSLCTARLLLSHEACANEVASPSAFDEDCAFFLSLAELGIEERLRSIALVPGSSATTAVPLRETCEAAFAHYRRAFRPSEPSEKHKLRRLLKTDLMPDIERVLFTSEGFLRGLGRMSLNLEGHGGLYALHSHLNHACTPNMSVRHLEQRTALARITLIASRDIAKGEELVITYVDPKARVRRRRALLAEWGFGLCRCARCVKEEVQAEGEEDKEGDLERELKEGLGLM